LASRATGAIRDAVEGRAARPWAQHPIRSGARSGRPTSYWLGLGLSIIALGLSCIIALGLSCIIALGLSCIIALGLSCIIALGLGLAPVCVHAATPMPRLRTPSASNPDIFRGDRYI
jgi:hypothetical protein